MCQFHDPVSTQSHFLWNPSFFSLFLLCLLCVFLVLKTLHMSKFVCVLCFLCTLPAALCINKCLTAIQIVRILMSK